MLHLNRSISFLVILPSHLNVIRVESLVQSVLYHLMNHSDLTLTQLLVALPASVFLSPSTS